MRASKVAQPQPRFDVADVSDAVMPDELDRRLVLATQAGLPLVPRPYDALAESLGVGAEEVIARLTRMLACGVIRRIGTVPNHYALGYKANGMSVWDVPDDLVSRLGRQVGALEFVSHCYHRPRHAPQWPYNLFAMVHGRDRAEVETKVAEIARLLGSADRGHTVLYSVRILKKTGMRLSAESRVTSRESEDQGIQTHDSALTTHD